MALSVWLQGRIVMSGMSVMNFEMRTEQPGASVSNGIATLALVTVLAAQFSVFWAFLISPLFAEEVRADLEVIVDRQPGSIELYVSLPADKLDDVFDVTDDFLAGRNGTVDFASLRNGTFDKADHLIAKVTTAQKELPIVFEGMSMMVHLKDSKVAFSDSFDGALAISVCAVDSPEAPPAVSDLHAYAGFIAFPEDESATVTLELPATSAPGFVVKVKSFEEGRPLGEVIRLLDTDRILAL
ncbi:MAG: hypothetical protein AAGE61_13610 [Pseudomonadota bacterium]